MDIVEQGVSRNILQMLYVKDLSKVLIVTSTQIYNAQPLRRSIVTTVIVFLSDAKNAH